MLSIILIPFFGGLVYQSSCIMRMPSFRWSQPTLSTDTPCPKAERFATTANVTPKTTNSNSVLPNTASNDIQQHVNSANSGDVDIRNLTVTLIRTVVLQRSWYQMPGCSVQCKMNKNTHSYMTVSGTPRVLM